MFPATQAKNQEQRWAQGLGFFKSFPRLSHQPSFCRCQVSWKPHWRNLQVLEPLMGHPAPLSLSHDRWEGASSTPHTPLHPGTTLLPALSQEAQIPSSLNMALCLHEAPTASWTWGGWACAQGRERPASALPIRALYLEQIKDSYNSIIKGQTTPLKNKKKNLSKHFSKEYTQMTNRHVKKYSTSFVAGEMQIKTTARYPSHPLGGLESVR